MYDSSWYKSVQGTSRCIHNYVFFHCLRCIVRIESGTKALFCDVISVRIESGTKALICGVNNDVVSIATTRTSLADTR